MRQKSRWISIIGSTVGVALVAAACSSAAATPTPGTAAMSPSAATSLTLAETNDPTLGTYLTGVNVSISFLLLTMSGSEKCSGLATVHPNMERILINGMILVIISPGVL